jgi:hypothetical protein
VAEVGSVSRLRPVHFVLLAVPLLWVALAFLHPDGEDRLSGAIADDVDRWLFVHAAQLVLTPFLAAGVWMLLLGIESAAAAVARIALAFWMVFFSAFDAVAGLASGVLVRHANSLAGAEREHVASAIDFMFHDSQFAAGSTLSVLQALGQGTWIIVAGAATLALYRAGASRLIVGATLVSVLFALHAGFPAAIGLVALFLAELLRFRTPGPGSEAVPSRSPEPRLDLTERAV